MSPDARPPAPLPDPWRFKLAEQLDADLATFGLTRSAARAIDLVTGRAIGIAIVIADGQLRAFPAVVEQLIERVLDVEAAYKGLLRVLLERGGVTAEDAAQITAEMAGVAAGRAVDRALNPCLDESVAALRAWLARVEEVNR